MMQRITKHQAHKLAMDTMAKYEDKWRLFYLEQAAENAYCDFECKHCEEQIKNKWDEYKKAKEEFDRRWVLSTPQDSPKGKETRQVVEGNHTE